VKFLITILAAVFTFLSTSATQAQQVKTSSGTYTTYLSEQPIGTDDYRLTVNPDGSAQAQADIDFANTKFRTTTKAAAYKPVGFTKEANGSPTLVVEIGNGVIKIKQPGQPDTEVNGQPTVLLENGVWHQFLFLFLQYDNARGGQQSFKAFVPSQAVPFTINLERLDSPSIKVGGQQISTQHFRAGTSLGLGFEIWTDAELVPLFMQVAAQHLKIVRKGSEALAESISPAPPPPVTSVSDLYTTEEVTFHNGDQKLVGTLTIPKKGPAPFPAAVIISGSGPQDRDGSDILNIYKLIAEHLSANGVAVLRADDRGAGKSQPITGGTYRNLIDDSRAAFEFLFNRPEIDHKKIALVGHSEGAETALTIATEDSRVAAIILLAGPSRSLDRGLIEQTLARIALQSPINPSDKTRYPTIVTQLDKAFRDAKTKPKPAAPETDQLAYFRQHVESDPLSLARRVRVPTLILNGERDDNVLSYHALDLAQAMADSGNKQVLLRIFPNLTHLFTPSKRDAAVTDAQAVQVSPEFLELLQSWAANVLVRGKDGGATPP
jgi:uncharacterized protein